MATKSYNFKDTTGKLVFSVQYGTNSNKEVYSYIYRFNENGKKVMDAGNPIAYPLYRLDLIEKSAQVLLVELEEDVDYLNEMGFVATTYPTNSKQAIWRDEYTDYLSGKDVVILHSKPDSETVEWNSVAALKLLKGTGKHGIGSVNSLRIVELPYPDYLSKAVTIKEWFEGNLGIKSEVELLINSADPVKANDLIASHEELIEEKLSDVIQNATVDNFFEALEAISRYNTLSIRTHYLKRLARKFQVKKDDVISDFEKHFGSLDPYYTEYYPGLIEVVSGSHDSTVSFLKIDDEGNLYASESSTSKRQTFFAYDEELLDYGYADFNTIEEYYEEASHSPREGSIDNFFRIYPPSAYERKLYSDVFKYLKQIMPLDDRFIDLITCFVFLTYLHDNNDVEQIPNLYLQVSSNIDFDAFPVKKLSYLLFRGVTQNYLNEHHMIRFTHERAATTIFKISDFEKTLQRNKLYDFFISRYKRETAQAYRLKYEEGKETMPRFNTFSPTIIVSTTPLRDDLLQKISLSMQIPEVRDSDVSTDYLAERLIAWRALVLHRSFDDIEEIDFYKPLMQVCRWVNPEGCDCLAATLKELEVLNTKTLEGEAVATFLVEHYPKHNVIEYDFGTVKSLAETISKHLRKEYSAKKLGHILKNELNLKTQKVHPGNMHLIASLNQMKRIRKMYRIKAPVTTLLDELTMGANEIVRANRDKKLVSK